MFLLAYVFTCEKFIEILLSVSDYKIVPASAHMSPGHEYVD